MLRVIQVVLLYLAADLLCGDAGRGMVPRLLSGHSVTADRLALTYTTGIRGTALCRSQLLAQLRALPPLLQSAALQHPRARDTPSAVMRLQAAPMDKGRVGGGVTAWGDGDGGAREAWEKQWVKVGGGVSGMAPAAAERCTCVAFAAVLEALGRQPTRFVVLVSVRQ